VDLLTHIFVYDPMKRITATQCMKHPFFADLFGDELTLPNGVKLPAYLKQMRSPEEMFRSFPDGPAG
jgi:serine/threonine protein kinase